MTRTERNIVLEFVNESMSKSTREALTTMCCECVRAFQSCLMKHPMLDGIPKVKSLISIMAIESAITHHELLTASHNDTTNKLAHQCAEAMIRTMLDSYDEDLTLEQNLELWKLKKA